MEISEGKLVSVSELIGSGTTTPETPETISEGMHIRPSIQQVKALASP